MDGEERVRFPLAKPGIDTHWWGFTMLTLGLREAGIDVITIVNVSPKEVVSSAVQEDVDMVGISVGCEDCLRYVPEIMNSFEEKGWDRPVILGGSVTKVNAPWFTELGIDNVFLPQEADVQV